MSLLLQDSNVDEFKQVFNLFDHDNDGVISITDLKVIMDSLGIETSEKDVQDMIKGIDVNNNGTVEMSEFLDMMKMNSKVTTSIQSDVESAFKCMDLDNDGFISPDELKTAIQRLAGNLMTDEDAAHMFNTADLNGDGKIDFSEFKQMMFKDDNIFDGMISSSSGSLSSTNGALTQETTADESKSKKKVQINEQLEMSDCV